MKIKFKGTYGTSHSLDKHKRGRSYDIGEIIAGVTLTDDGLTLFITNIELSKKLKEWIEVK